MNSINGGQTMSCKIDLTLGNYIKKNKISRNELCRRTGMVYSQIQRYCDNNIKRVDLTVLERICDAIPDCNLDDIIKLTRQK